MHGNYNGKYQTRIIDASGNEFLATKSQIGNSASSRYSESDFIQNVPINANLYFNKLPSGVNKLRVIKISLYNSEKMMLSKLDLTILM
ncbi:hypothetical protein NIES2101_09040 [Calothrix sp. HK-06]|nr:hypothetical protein NIES2101_09040 [Calothrix sp. HK-06]